MGIFFGLAAAHWLGRAISPLLGKKKPALNAAGVDQFI
jgi:hypothetical protein